MTLRSIALVVLIVAAAFTWVFYEDSEAQVRSAHDALWELISKTADETVAGATVNSLALRDLFATTIEISGDAEGLVGVYSPEELAGTIIRLRSIFNRIDVQFGELQIAFPTPEAATVEFSAQLDAAGRSAAVPRRSESRQVVSHMRDIDGTWRFSELRLIYLSQRGD